MTAIGAERASAGHIPDMTRRVAYRRDGAFSVNLCTEAINFLFKAGGGGGLERAGARSASSARRRPSIPTSPFPSTPPAPITAAWRLVCPPKTQPCKRR
jgi:hypothetical protein